MCIAGLFGQQQRTPGTPPPPPAPPVDPIKPPPPTEVLKKDPVSIAPATSKRKGLGIGQEESPASGGVPLGIGANSDNKTINTGVG